MSARRVVVMVVVVAALALAAALLEHGVDHDRPPARVGPSMATGALTHPREGGMYHQPYTSTR